MKLRVLAVAAILVCLSDLAIAQSTETVLYAFGAYPSDGITQVGGLLSDPAGNLYGVTSGGGQYCAGQGGCGTVYELSPSAGGVWTETILYDFCAADDPPACPDGDNPGAGLIRDLSGNLYGTTYGGGAHAYGTVF